MKVAKEQANVRERAATYHHQGQGVPQEELIAKYEKAMRAKLGRNRQSAPGQSSRRLAEPQQVMPAPQLSPPAVHGYPGASTPGAWPSPAGGGVGSPSQGQGLVQPNLFGGGVPQMGGMSPYGSPAGGMSPGGSSPYGAAPITASPHGQRYGTYG